MFGTVFFFTVLATVNDFFRICQEEYMIQLLLNGSDASGVAAFEDVGDLLGKSQGTLLHDVSVFDDVYCNVVVDDA